MFSLNYFFSAAIDQRNMKSPNFLSIEIKTLKLFNAYAKLSKYWSVLVDLDNFFLWDFLSVVLYQFASRKLALSYAFCELIVSDMNIYLGNCS